jgi:Zn-dependent M28 family amino/carboxypeptidase
MKKAASVSDIKMIRDNLYRHVDHLSVKIGERHLWKERSLDRTADYIEEVLEDSGYDVYRQTFIAYGQAVSNLIVEKSGREGGVVVVGAHYDTVPGSPGADDNASGVAGMLELARLCKNDTTRKLLIFAAFVNEESPCFGSLKMGSMVYAESLKASGVRVEIMIALEAIGYFAKNEVQQYPLPGMRLFYPASADFLAVVGNFPSTRYVYRLKRGIKGNADIKVRSFIAPAQVGGINRSDNSAFWHHGFRAVMLTDTAHFRNKNYHQETDTIDSLNFDTMAEVIRGLYHTLQEI